jgi:hypothetical protein
MENNPELQPARNPDRLAGIREALGYQVLSVKDAACFAGVSVAHMHRAARGAIPNTPRLRVFRVGRRVLIRTDWLDEWMRATPQAPDISTARVVNGLV